MNARRVFRLMMALMLLVLQIPAMGAAYVETAPCSQDAGAAGCVDLTLNPAGVLGDVYVDGAQVAAQVPAVRLSLAPDAAHQIDVRNITEAVAGYGDVFVYGDLAQANVQIAAGKVQSLVLKATRNYLKGYVNFTCDIKGVAGQQVQCQVSADGAGLGVLNPGETGSWALATGPHGVHIDLVGADMGLWAPATSDLAVTVAGGKTAALKASYDRKGQLTLKTNVPGVVADFYVDGVLVASQVAEAVAFVAPGTHVVEAKVLTDPAANGVYMYPDTSAKGTVKANQAQVVTLKPAKTFLLGFAQVSCAIKAVVAGQDVRCAVTIDGNGMGTLEVGQSQVYNLTPGAHTVNLALNGANADLWAPLTVDLPLNIVAGKTAATKMTFDRKGQLTLKANVPGVVGDFYVDGVLVASQVPEAVAFVAPGTHVVEGKAFNDPAANGVYVYPDSSAKGTVKANQTQVVTLKLVKTFVLGFAEVSCGIKAVEPGQDVRCAVTIDGNGMGTLEVGQVQVYNLAPGAHTVNVALNGGNAGIWGPAAIDYPINIVAGKTTKVASAFDRKGIVNISLDDADVVADIFVDGVQVASQVNSYQVVVDPGVPHQLEARNLVYVQAPKSLGFDNISSSVTVKANQTQNAVLKIGIPRILCAGNMARISFRNTLPVDLNFVMNGPESATILIPANSVKNFCVLPGTYQTSVQAGGYRNLDEERTYTGEACESFTIYANGSEPTSGHGCSLFPFDYSRP